MKTLNEQKETAKKYFDKHNEQKILGPKDWNLFWLGWLEKGYEIAYDEFEEYKNDTNNTNES